MPAIPIYQQRVSANGPLPAVNTSAPTPQDPTGAALANVGRSLQGVVDVQTDIVAREQADQARVWAGMAASDWHVKQMQQLEDRKATAQGAASGFTPEFLKSYDESSQAVVQMAPNEVAKRYLQQQIDATRTTLAAHALRFEADRLKDWKLSTGEQTVMNAGKIVQADPSQFAQQFDTIRDTLPAVDPATDAARLAAARGHLVNAAAGSMLDRNPYAVQAATSKAMGADGHVGPVGEAWVDSATPEQVKHWHDQATVRIRQVEADKARDSDASAKLAVDAVQKLQTFSIEGRMPSPEYEAEVAMLTRGTPWEPQARALMEQAKAGASFGAQTLPRQQAALSALEGKPTDPQSAALAQHARSVFESQSRAAKDDPWAFGARFQRLPDVPQVPIADASILPALVGQRIPLMGKLEAATGFAVSPLRPGEVQQAATALSAMPIPQRAEVLGQLGDMLKNQPERLVALADQLDKGNKPMALSLKLGADRTTAGRMASELVQRGAQALADKTVKRDDQALAGWRADIAAKVRGTLGDPKAEDDVIEAAYYTRAAQELEGIAAPGFTKGIGSGAEDAIALVAGAPIERGGVKTLLPRGMTADQFDAKTQAALAPMAGQRLFIRGQPVPAESVALHLGGYGMRFNRGGYTPIINNAPVTMDSAGSVPLVLRVQ